MSLDDDATSRRPVSLDVLEGSLDMFERDAEGTELLSRSGILRDNYRAMMLELKRRRARDRELVANMAATIAGGAAAEVRVHEIVAFAKGAVLVARAILAETDGPLP